MFGLILTLCYGGNCSIDIPDLFLSLDDCERAAVLVTETENLTADCKIVTQVTILQSADKLFPSS